ncbi:putative disease resistance protein RGA4 [Eucalyptus grandis]|uniref:putative disease resistance protein RGA4 n=1 Tax=Eucalyptus grandis TaxID=71139 RepID=UPI00192E7972|nr:putative disease resistance protein RGA4 [Eucalyptus grandis]
MAEAVIVSIVGEIVASLAPQAIENIGKLWGNKQELEALRDTVSTLQAVLDDAEEQYYRSREIKDWVDRLKGAFYDALDVLEEYNVEATRQELRGHNKIFKEVRKFFSGSNQVAFILKMSHKVRAVKKRIEVIEANRKFGLNMLPEREWRKREETHSFACEGDIIGRDDDKETVKKFLLDLDVKGNVSILPIVGIGGLGKTTLAQHVYNDKMVSEHFELKMWVCVSNDFDMKKIVKNILAGVMKEELNYVMEQLQNELRRVIDGRRYLLVLDDYWDAKLETWLKLKSLLVGGARGSKILITTRLHSVADITYTTLPYLLGGLSKIKSVDLLMQMAFPKGEETQDPDLRPIGEEIARRLNCFILPKDKACAKNYGKLGELYGLNNIRGSLCIENLGHVTDAVEEYKAANLTGKQSLESLELKWGGFNTDDAVIWTGTRNEALLDALQPPSNLQELTITGYEGESFPRWMMDSLVSSLPNLVEVEFKDCGRCKRLSPLGQLPHLKILRISRLDELEYIESGHSSTSTASFPSLLKLHIFYCKKLKAMPLTSHLGDNISGQRVRHLPNLVDLFVWLCDELDLCKDESGNILDFQGLQCLRYVNIKGLPKLAYLPQWLVQASNLELLKIDGCNLKALPEQIEAFQSLQRLKIVSCRSLISLPKGMQRLASLTDLVFDNCDELDISKDERSNILDFHGGLHSLRHVKMNDLPKLAYLPQWLVQASNLELLEIRDCDLKALPEQIEAFRSLQRLEIIRCRSLTSLPTEMRRLASLTDLVFIDCEELNISKDESGNILDFHGGLQTLRSLQIIRLPKLESLPHWILQLRSLESLHIEECEELDISKDESGNILDFHGGLQTLHSVFIYKLPKLTSLPQWVLQASNLKGLNIIGCDNLKDIPEQIEALQSLQTLRIHTCSSLTSFPEAMRRLTSLTALYIMYCGELGDSCKRQAGEDWEKIAHIPNKIIM